MTSGKGAAATGGVFARTSSGLIRAMGKKDMIFFALMAGNPMALLFLQVPLYSGLLAGAYLPWAYLLAGLLVLPPFILYSGLGSMMPRTGGDYVYQSRGLTPGTGFSIIGAWYVIWFGAVITTSALYAAAGGFTPILLLVGYSTGNVSLQNAGLWFTTPMGIYSVMLAFMLVGLLHVSLGTKAVVKVQNWLLIPGVVLSTVLIPAVLFLTSPSAFHASFDKFGSSVFGIQNYYNNITSIGTNAAVNPPTFSLGNTLLDSIFPFGWIAFTVFPAMGILGEVKNANNMKLLFYGFLAAGFFGLLAVNLLSVVAAYHTIGWGFVQSASAAFLGGATPYWPTLPLLAGVASGNVLLEILIPIGFITVGYFTTLAIYMISSRITVAMSIDGLIPEFFSNINSRLLSPVIAVTTVALFSIFFATVYTFYPASDVVIIQGASYTSLGGMMITGLAAVVFRWRRKNIYQGSPISRYNVGKIPLLSIVGAITFGMILVMLVTYFIFPQMGVVVPADGLVNGYLLGIIAVFIPVIILLVWYYGYKSYRRGKGLIVDAAFAEIPPA